MRIKLTMRLVAVVLCTVLVLEDPMTALASSDPPAGERVYDDLTERDADPSDGASDPDKLTDKDNLSDVTVKPEAEIISEDLDAEGAQTDFEAAIDDIPADNDKAPVKKVAVKDKDPSPDKGMSDEDTSVLPEDEDETDTITGAPLSYELTQNRTENSLTYSRTDHSITTFYYADPVNYQADDGSWRLIDNRLHYSGANISTNTIEKNIDDLGAIDPGASEEATDNSAFPKPLREDDKKNDDKDAENEKESAADPDGSILITEDIDNTGSGAGDGNDSDKKDQDFDGFVNNDASFDVKFAEEATMDHILSFGDDKRSIVLAYVPVSADVKKGIKDKDDPDVRSPKDDRTENDKVIQEDVSSDEISDLKASDVILSGNDASDEEAGSDNPVNSDMSDKDVKNNPLTSTDNDDTSNSDKEEKTAEWSRKITLVDVESGEEIDTDTLKSAYADGLTVDEQGDLTVSDSVPSLNASDEGINSDNTDVPNLGDNSDLGTEDDPDPDTDDEEEADDGEDAGKEIYYPELPISQTVLYSGIEEGVDLRYELLPDGIKETIVLNKAGVPSSYVFTLDIGTMNAKKTDEGDVLLYGKGSDPLFEIPAPVVCDGKGSAGKASYDITLSEDGTLTLEVKTDKEWLGNASRVFPVEIDPTIKRYRRYEGLDGLGDFVSVCSDGTKDLKTFKVGVEKAADESGKKTKYRIHRTLMNSKLPKVDAGSVVTDAHLRIDAGSATQVFYAVPMTKEWKKDTVRYSDTKPLSTSYKNITDFGKNGTVLLDVTKDVKVMASGKGNVYGWCLISSDEKTESLRKVSPHKVTEDNKKPFFEVTYRDFTGTEDYYSTHTQSAGSAGCGSINDYTGRLTFAHADATSAGERMTLSVSHVYDYAYGERTGEDKWSLSGGSSGAYGEHFRLSTDVRLLVPVGEADIKTYPYVYIDSDGTKHYFKKATVKYYVNGAEKSASKNSGTYPAGKDEDGLGLFVVPVTSGDLKDECPLKIVNKSGSSSMYFDKDGYLRFITDSNQREDKKNGPDTKYGKERNRIEISYDDLPMTDSNGKAFLDDISERLGEAYDKDLSIEELRDLAQGFISEIEAFEVTSFDASVNYKVALSLQKAKDDLNKIVEGDSKSGSKTDFSNASKAVKEIDEKDLDAKKKRAASVEDAAGQKAVLSYDNGLLTTMSDPYEGGALITYEYDRNGRLIRINHPNGTYASYFYDNAGHLTRAVDERGYRIDYAYGTNTVKTGKGTEKVITDQVVKFTEYVGNKAGQTVLASYDEFNATAYTFSGLDEKTDTKDDIENIYCFDHKGRTVSCYSRFKTTKEVIGSSVKSYTDDDKDDTSQANKVKESASTGSQVINLLTDSGFEKEPGKKGTPAWDTFITDTTGKNSVKRDGTDKYIGSKAGHVTFTAGSSDKEAGFKQIITVPESGYYTASVYIKTKGLGENTKARIRLSGKKNTSESGDTNSSESDSTEGSGEGADESGDDGDPEDGSATSEEGYVDSDTQPDINNGWKRIETTIKANKGESITLTLSLSGDSGEAWFDCAQIEKGMLANQYNLLSCAGFEDGFKENASLPGIPSGWAYGAEAIKSGQTIADEKIIMAEDEEDGTDPEEEPETESLDDPDLDAVRIVDAKAVGSTVVEGSKVLLISGNPMKKRSVIINPNFGTEKASYTFSCYVKADCAPVPEKSKTRKCGIYVRGDNASYNEDDATGKYKSISGTSAASAQINTQFSGWQYVTVSLPVRSWKGKLIEIRFDYEVGTLCIDGCMLTKNEVQTKTYTAGGKLKTSQKGERTTTYATDGRDRRSKEKTAGGASTTYKYDGTTNDLIKETHSFKQLGSDSAFSLVTEYAYDKYGNQTEVTETANGIKQSIFTGTEYTDDGRFAIKSIDSRGNVTESAYDTANGQLIKQTDATDVDTSYSYDQYHQPTGVSSEGVDALYTYDNKVYDRLKTIQTGEGKTGETYSFKYDAYGNTTNITRASKDKKLLANTYMPNNGKIKTTTYGNGNKLTYGYNTLEQITSESWNSKDVTRYEYDNRGNKARITDALSGLKYRYFYDDKGRITTAEITKTIGKTSSELISFQSIYDKAGRQSVFAYYTGGRAYRTEYGYTSDDKVGAATLPSGGTFKRTYDGFDRITKDIFTPQAKPGTGETIKRGGGAAVTSTYGYLGTDRDPENDQADGLDGVKYKYTTRLLSDLNVTIGSGKTATTAVSETLSYDNLGRIDSWGINSSAYSENSNIADSSKTTYTYDNLGRLIKAADTGNDRTWEYTYDSIGNITSSIYTDKEGVHEETYNYDRDNLISYNGDKIDGYKGGNPKTYLGNTLTWERGRQLMSVTPTKQKLREKSDAQTVSYTYAYDGSRLSKTVGKTKKDPGTTTEYILNGSTILVQNTTYPNGEKETLNFYYSSDGKLLEIGYLKSDADGNIPKDTLETHYSVIRNAMGDVCALYTSDGTLVGTYEYDPYGRLLSETSNPSYADTEEILHKNPFRYRGYYYDSEIGWYYLQSRYYDPEVKRFINADSTDLLTTDCMNLMQYNLFMYCNGDPVNKADDNGTCPIWAKKVGIAIAVVGVVAAVAAITVATAGAGTAAAIVAVGAAKGAAVGMISGAAMGASLGAVTHRISSGTWEGSGSAALDGMGNGALSGAVTGAISGAVGSAVKVSQAAKAWDSGTFDSGFDSMKHHYHKHVELEGYADGNNVIKYTQDAQRFADRNSSLLQYTYNYKYDNATWNYTYTNGPGGMFSSDGSIITFWYGGQ